MNRPNMSYGMRMPKDQEIVDTFGSLARAAQITGGDLPTILFYLANVDRIATAQTVGPQPGAWALDFVERANVERASAAFDEMERPSIAAVSRQLGVCRPVARRALVAAGKVPE